MVFGKAFGKSLTREFEELGADIATYFKSKPNLILDGNEQTDTMSLGIWTLWSAVSFTFSTKRSIF